jgi:hypothetical protein
MEPEFNYILGEIQKKNTIFFCNCVEDPLDDNHWVITLKFAPKMLYSSGSVSGNCKSMVAREFGGLLIICLGALVMAIAIHIDDLN